MTRFFEATATFEREYRSLFDFIGASGAAIWTMRWQVQGYAAAHPEATEATLAGHFLSFPKVGKFNFNYFRDFDWETQEEQIARMALVNAIALYERWLEGMSPLTIVKSIGKNKRTKLGELCEAISVSSDLGYVKAALKIGEALHAARSPVMRAAFGNGIYVTKGYMGADLRAMLVAYRAFKELRNNFMHRNELPDVKLIEVFEQLAKESFTNKFLKRKPACFPVVAAGTVPRLLLEHAYFACYVIRCLVSTLDGDLAMTLHGRNLLIEKFRGDVKTFGSFKSDSALGASVGRHITRFRLPTPANPKALLPLLRTGKIIRTS